MKSRKTHCVKPSMKLRFCYKSSAVQVKFFEELSGSDSVVVDVLLNSHHQLVDFDVGFFQLICERMTRFASSKCFRHVYFSNFWSWQFINIRNDNISREVFHRVVLVAPFVDVSKGLKKSDVVDGVAKFDKTFQQELEFFRPKRDSGKIENAAEMLNGDGSVVLRSFFIILKKNCFEISRNQK